MAMDANSVDLVPSRFSTGEKAGVAQATGVVFALSRSEGMAWSSG